MTGGRCVGGGPDDRNNSVVLLVQPGRDDREMYAEGLRYHGFQSVPVRTAADALTVAPYADVVVTGILLAGQMDGIELVRRLKSAERTKHIPVIVLTACAYQSDRDRAAAAGCERFLAKPCLPDVLVATIRRVLMPGRVHREAAPAQTPGSNVRMMS